MRFYIDFENVNGGGLKGIENLKQSDIVMIYYSNNPGLNMDTVRKMMQTKATIEFQKLSDGIKNMNRKNALDIVILNDISRLTSNQLNEGLTIVSNDTGYDRFAISGRKLQRASSIAKASQMPSQPKKSSSGASNINEQELSALFKRELSEFSSYRKLIMHIIRNSKTRSQINNALAKEFYSDDVGEIMKAIKPFIKHLPGK